MDEFTVDAFANRDEPIPVLSFGHEDDLSDEGDGLSSPGRKRDILRRHGKSLKENLRSTGSSMQDRILEKWASIRLSSRAGC
jgi:hypothetical protein